MRWKWKGNEKEDLYHKVPSNFSCCPSKMLFSLVLLFQGILAVLVHLSLLFSLFDLLVLLDLLLHSLLFLLEDSLVVFVGKGHDLGY